MPFTALHAGPSVLIKSLTGQSFSLLIFVFAQIAMDIEPLLSMIRGAERLHGITHTYLAAVGIALAVALLTPPLRQVLVRRWNWEMDFYHQHWLTVAEIISPLVIVSSALVGTLSHVAIDSLMHADMTPFAPLSAVNPWCGAISVEVLHQFCLMSGATGAVLWLVQKWRRRRAIDG